MRDFISVCYYTMIRVWRDSATFLEQIMLPIALILVLGTALGGAFKGRDIGATPVAYVIESENPAAESVRTFLDRDDVSAYLSAVDAGTMEEANELLRAQKAVTVIHVPEHFGQSGETHALTLIERSGNQLRTGIVRAVLRNYTLGANVTLALQNEFPEAAEEEGISYKPIPAHFEVQEITRTGRAPGAFDFYAVSMLILTLMFIASYSADALKEDILDATGSRIKTTAVRPWVYFSGRFAANSVSGLVQAALIVSLTFLIFGVDWGTRPLLLSALIASITLFAVSLGAFLVALLRDGQKAQTVVSALVIGSMIVSGGAVQFGSSTESFRFIQRLLPHYQGQTAMLAMIYNRAPGSITEAFIYFLGGSSIAFALTLLLSRRSA
jgi:ABC-2 type transport system permease protein